MRIVFMGTPDFAASSLKKLYEDGHDICGVFTQPDKPKNRGHKVVFSPVKELALEHGTPIYQPATLRDGTALEELKRLNPELIAVVAYGKLLPKEILELPRYGCINIHGSLLPKYRGSAPIQWTILNGERSAGVTSMYMAEEMDAGDIIGQVAIPVERNETAGELYERLAWVGAKLLGATVQAIKNKTAKRIPQNPEKATFAPPLSKEMSPIDWNKTPIEILNHINGLNPWPVATAEFGDITFKIFKAEIMPQSEGKPGTVVAADKLGIRVAASGGDVLITELQAPGGKRMRASDYLRGHPLEL